MLNKVILHGRLTKDPTVYTNNNKSWCSFDLAVQRDVKDTKTNSYITDFFTVKVFGKTSEFVTKFFKKGVEALVTGRIQIDSYEKDGKKLYSTSVMADSVEFCGTKSSNELQDQSKQTPTTKNTDKIDVTDDDFPF